MARTIGYSGHWNKSVRGVVKGKHILNKVEELRRMDKDDLSLNVIVLMEGYTFPIVYMSMSFLFGLFHDF